jgi:hypothetical protein
VSTVYVGQISERLDLPVVVRPMGLVTPASSVSISTQYVQPVPQPPNFVRILCSHAFTPSSGRRPNHLLLIPGFSGFRFHVRDLHLAQRGGKFLPSGSHLWPHWSQMQMVALRVVIESFWLGSFRYNRDI